jgi:hypothetical protein
VITFPFHLPRIKYGSAESFKAPIILLNNKETLKGKIRIFSVDNRYEIIQKEILIININ